jgi:hypothetical protein
MIFDCNWINSCVQFKSTFFKHDTIFIIDTLGQDISVPYPTMPLQDYLPFLQEILKVEEHLLVLDVPSNVCEPILGHAYHHDGTKHNEAYPRYEFVAIQPIHRAIVPARRKDGFVKE